MALCGCETISDIQSSHITRHPGGHFQSRL
jgi:isopentenyl diphosphate isomerase/L-lactate dehydrogenase-like FMN-dependent dehydrogenase